MNDRNNSEMISTKRMLIMTFIWFLLNVTLLLIAYYSFSFMFEARNFYGKGSNGILLIVGYGMYKVHKSYFKYVALLGKSL